MLQSRSKESSIYSLLDHADRCGEAEGERTLRDVPRGSSGQSGSVQSVHVCVRIPCSSIESTTFVRFYRVADRL